MKDKNELLASSHDGIQEYDNDLPKWWVQLFIATIIYSVGYVGWRHFTSLASDHDWSTAEVKGYKEAQAKTQKPQDNKPEETNESLLVAFQDPTKQTAGQPIFALRCAPCHGQKGEGLVGPNLTDEFWIHGSTPLEVKQVVEKGVLDKGMLAWKGMLKDDEIEAALAFLWSIRNTNVPGKAPQGTK
jgi:cytochrome c oxidase cbb3-type subunit 3